MADDHKSGESKDAKVHGSYFSIAFNLVLQDQPIPYDLYVNSSALQSREKYVRIFPSGGVLAEADLYRYREKYHQLYIPETQRSAYLKSLCNIAGKQVEEKALVLKDSAIHYLDTLFDQKKEFSTEMFNQAIEGCHDVVVGFVDTLQGVGVDNLQELIAKLSFHDFYTYDHSINVSMYCILLHQLAKPDASKAEIINAGFGGLLHDMGKLKIPTEIINKAGKLTDAEFAMIKQHPTFGFEILSSAGIKVPQSIQLGVLKNVVYQHHENFDGSGYPNKINGLAISIDARITAIADFFDAITTKRSYHEALTTDEALALMKKTAGRKIDPQLFDLLCRHTQHFDRTKKTKLHLVEDFDPCQPNQVPWQEGEDSAEKWPRPAADKGGDYGKIIMKTPPKKKSA